jgi:catechol 2,3-dioxygenase
MKLDPLDVEALIHEHAAAEWSGLPPATTIGHVHLHVSDLEAAGHFYVGTLGMDLMQRLGSAALFVSAGGYHHHLGLNTWAGRGAPAPPADAIGLRWFEIRLPGEAARQAVLRRLDAAGVKIAESDDGPLVRDPSGNGIRLVLGWPHLP